jgi:predicted dehydrogenase
VGLVGAGFAARQHARAWRRVAGIRVDIKGVAAAHPERAVAFASEHGHEHGHEHGPGLMRAYADTTELFRDPEVTLVDLCVPNDLHRPLALEAIRAGKHVVVEKPLTGCFEDPASTKPTAMLEHALAAADELIAAAHNAGRLLCYAENWVYAPPVETAARLLAGSRGTILRIQGEESHSGTHAPANKRWASAGGGSLLGKGCHPLAAALWLKGEEGRRRNGHALRAVDVTAETASLTRVPTFVAEEPKHLQTGYENVEDWGAMVVRFEDGAVAEIAAADITLGGIRNQLTIFASNAVIEANLNPNTAVRAYAPDEAAFAGQHLSEKLETTAGWSYPSPDEDWMQGYPQEAQAFAEAVTTGEAPRSDGALARDVLEVIYAAYVSAAEGRRVKLSSTRPSRSRSSHRASAGA